MNVKTYLNACRACLSQNIVLKSIFSTVPFLDQELMLCDMLMACSSCWIIINDDLPQNLCLNCIEEVQRSYSFRKLAEKSEAIVRQAANIEENIPLENTESTTGEPIDSCNDNDINDSDNEPYLAKENEKNITNRKSYKCEECNENCLGLASYFKHMTNTHGTHFKCNHCDKRFRLKRLLSAHLSKFHPEGASPHPEDGKKPRTCDICHKTFRFHSNLRRHRLTHTGEKPYLCNVCGKAFGQRSYLRIHSFIHTGEKPYKCQVCGIGFSAPGTLLSHVRIHTGERPYVCKICGKTFHQSGYLGAHIRTHTGEKPKECRVCHQRFNQSGRLRVHMRIHSGEKPFSCKECGKSFAVKGTLKKHIRTHTGERPYVCTICDMAFAQSGTLATHMKVHKPKNGTG